MKKELEIQGYCPECGGLPLMAKLQKGDGKRILQCRVCGTQWPFMRIKCIYCGNEYQNALRFFWTDDLSPYRVDVCDKCKGYIKTVDARKMEKEPDLLDEDIATQYLDILAVKEGYKTNSISNSIGSDHNLPLPS